MIADIYSAGNSVRYLKHRLGRERATHRPRPPAPPPHRDPIAHAIAVHEAGHAVICAAVGGRVGMVVRHPENAGGSCHGIVPYAAPLAHHVAFHLAGATAERVLLGTAAQPSSTDQLLTRKLLRGALTAERMAARSEGAELAERLVRAHTDIIKRLGDRLTDATLVRGPELSRLLQPARHGHNPKKEMK